MKFLIYTRETYNTMLRHQEIRLEKKALFNRLEKKNIEISDYVHKINEFNAELHECETIIDHIIDIYKIFPTTSLESVFHATSVSDLYTHIQTDYFWDCDIYEIKDVGNVKVELLDYIIDNSKKNLRNITIPLSDILSELAGNWDNDILVDRLKEQGLFEIYAYTQGCRNIEQFKKISDISQPSLNKCLINACVNSNIPLVEYLVNRGANNLDAGLFKCIASSQIALSEVLINMGACASDQWMTVFNKSFPYNIQNEMRTHILKMLRKGNID